MNNLKGVSCEIPKRSLTVITGVSGSGKSSLAFDTLFAEGQRRYVESLSSYARQFLGRMARPDVESIEGIAPAIAIQQKTRSSNPRSTVGTITEIYDFLKILYARLGKTYSPVSGREVKRYQVSDVSDYLLTCPDGTRFFILAPFRLTAGRDVASQAQIWLQQGFSRVLFHNDILNINDFIEQAAREVSVDEASAYLYILIDRMAVDGSDPDFMPRVGDSVQTAFFEGDGDILLLVMDGDERKKIGFSNRFEMDDMTFVQPDTNFFTFNNPYGACKTCEGFGSVIGIDEKLVIPNPILSVYEGAIAPWKGEKMREWLDYLLRSAHKFDFPIHTPYKDLSADQKKLIWTGNKHFGGLNMFFEMLTEASYKIQNRVMLSRFKGKTICPDCRGSRLRKDASYVKINGISLPELLMMQVDEVKKIIDGWLFSENEQKAAGHLVREIRNRLEYLCETGLPYLTLNRVANTLSGGETQRIHLARALGSSLTDAMYILDEPSIGLHPADTDRLIAVLKKLKSLGNTVVVVEHDEEIIRECDHLIDLGPFAGVHGGEIVFEGSFDQLQNNPRSQTSRYFNGEISLPVNRQPRPAKYFVRLRNLYENNLKSISVDIPLQCITAVTGVSGSGKSTLIEDVLYTTLKKRLNGHEQVGVSFLALEGDWQMVRNVEMIDQNPIGRSSRSNPSTYLKIYDDIRELFATQALAKQRGYKPGFFSFNIPGGRCETCQGEGMVTIEMQFMADVRLVCDECNGKRFKEEVLDINVNGKTIFDILNLTVDEAAVFFDPERKENSKFITQCKRISDKLQPLLEVGLGYVKLGQSSDTFSGGEAQRLKLATFLLKGSNQEPTLFIFDEPTTGLHYYDIAYFYKAIEKLTTNGHTIVLIEHNMELVKCADWIIDLGPEGGDKGGYLLFQGHISEFIKQKDNSTAGFLAEKWN